MLDINNLNVSIENNDILKNLNLTIKKNELHAIMGKNGCGKSTLASAIMGFSFAEIKSGDIKFKNIKLLEFDINERSKMGIFLSYQNPIAISGITVGKFLKRIFLIHRQNKTTVSAVANPVTASPIVATPESNSTFAKELFVNLSKLSLPREFTNRYLNDGFSGGEKKKLEMLQILTIKPEMVILDEIDSGLDSDAMTIIANAILDLKSQGVTFLIISHQKRLFDYIKPDIVSVLHNGNIAKQGDANLIQKIETDGYQWLDN